MVFDGVPYCHYYTHIYNILRPALSEFPAYSAYSDGPDCSCGKALPALIVTLCQWHRLTLHQDSLTSLAFLSSPTCIVGRKESGQAVPRRWAIHLWHHRATSLDGPPFSVFSAAQGDTTDTLMCYRGTKVLIFTVQYGPIADALYAHLIPEQSANYIRVKNFCKREFFRDSI